MKYYLKKAVKCFRIVCKVLNIYLSTMLDVRIG